MKIFVRLDLIGRRGKFGIKLLLCVAPLRLYEALDQVHLCYVRVRVRVIVAVEAVRMLSVQTSSGAAAEAIPVYTA